MSNVKGILTALVMLALFGIVGELDLQAAEADRAHYCEMVKAGHWPNADAIDNDKLFTYNYRTT